MIHKETIHLNSYFRQLDALKRMATITNSKVAASTPDEFFMENVNFFTKSYTVMMCAYLESYIKDALMVLVEETNKRLSTTSILHNLVKWSFDMKSDLKDKDCKYETLKININKKDLDDYISGNPYRTIILFKKFGIDLSKDNEFHNQKDKIGTIVTKRNNIVHHNDDASDLTFADINSNIDFLKIYIKNLDSIINSHLTTPYKIP